MRSLHAVVAFETTLNYNLTSGALRYKRADEQAVTDENVCTHHVVSPTSTHNAA